MSNLSKNYIAGDWTEGVSTITNVNPSDTTDIIGQYAQASSVQLDDALNVTQIAQRQWAATGLEQRQAVLMKIGEEMMVRSTELGELLSREEGKPVAEGKGEVYRAGQFFTYYAAEVLRQSGDTEVQEGAHLPGSGRFAKRVIHEQKGVEVSVALLEKIQAI